MSNPTNVNLYKDDKGLTEERYEGTGGYCLQRSETNAKNRFAGKTIIITGGGGNFGSAAARRFSSEGSNVALIDLRDSSDVSEECNKVAKANGHNGTKAKAYAVDVTDEKAVNDVVDKIKQEFGRVDYLFNNAGYQGHFTQAKDYDVADFRKVLDINVTGVFIMLQAVAKVMIAQTPQGGVIVNTASMAAHSGPPNMIAYGTSKAAVFHMTRIAAKDYAPYNIRINSVSPAFIGPGFMWTRQIELQAAANSQYYDKDPKVVAQQMLGCTPLRRYGSIDEVIGPVAFLMSDDASYLTGIDIEITGGMN